MSPNPDFLVLCRPSGWRLGLCAAVSLMLAACSALPWFSGRPGNNAGQGIAQPPAAATAAAQAASSPASNPIATPPPEAPPPDAVTRMLTYAERVRLMPPAELNQEAARLSAPAEVALPASQLQLSLVLSQLRQLPELIRAQELLARVLSNAAAEAQQFHPLARLLAFRFGEQRRLEDQIEREREKERQQTREVQRKLDQALERLEALKAIERSLNARPPAPPPPAPVAAPAPASPAASRGRTSPP
jgi:hypothetical protein